MNKKEDWKGKTELERLLQENGIKLILIKI